MLFHSVLVLCMHRTLKRLALKGGEGRSGRCRLWPAVICDQLHQFSGLVSYLGIAQWVYVEQRTVRANVPTRSSGSRSSSQPQSQCPAHTHRAKVISRPIGQRSYQQSQSPAQTSRAKPHSRPYWVLGNPLRTATFPVPSTFLECCGVNASKGHWGFFTSII